MGKNDKPQPASRKAERKAATDNSQAKGKATAPSSRGERVTPKDTKGARPPAPTRPTSPQPRSTANSASQAASGGPDFPIVGIGASAGGLAAFEAFFSAMPQEHTGMAFVLVPHLAPDHKSILHEIVGRYTRMDVNEVEDGMTVRPNCAYIIPPNRDMSLVGSRLVLSVPPATRGLRLPIDHFFRSLAQQQRERAICVVLSGTGSDGIRDHQPRPARHDRFLECRCATHARLSARGGDRSVVSHADPRGPVRAGKRLSGTRATG